MQRLAAALLHEGLGKSSQSGYVATYTTIAATTTTLAGQVKFRETAIFTYAQEIEASERAI